MPFFRINEIDLYYEIRGQGDAVLLIPGLGSDAATWQPLVEEFQKNFRLVVMENRGSGRSSKPEGPYTTSQMADEAALLMEHLEIDRAHIIGKSMGGMIAQILAARYPEKTRSLVLASSLLRHDGYGEELLEMGRETAQHCGLFAAEGGGRTV